MQFHNKDYDMHYTNLILSVPYLFSDMIPLHFEHLTKINTNFAQNWKINKNEEN